MLKSLIHWLFHTSQNQHVHKYIEDSMQIEYNEVCGFITGSFITTCPKCGDQSTRKVAFIFDSQETIDRRKRITELTAIDFTQYSTTLEQAKLKCINYTGDWTWLN